MTTVLKPSLDQRKVIWMGVPKRWVPPCVEEPRLDLLDNEEKSKGTQVPKSPFSSDGQI